MKLNRAFYLYAENKTMPSLYLRDTDRFEYAADLLLFTVLSFASIGFSLLLLLFMFVVGRHDVYYL